jgi:hypothetical protein
MTEVPFPVVPEATAEMLTDKQLVDYRSHHRQFIEWLLVEGKAPTELRGYADGTAKRTAYRVAKAARWTWETRGGYRLPRTGII